MKIDVESLAAADAQRPDSCNVSFSNIPRLRFLQLAKSKIRFVWQNYSFSNLLAVKIAVSLAILGVIYLFIDVPAAFAKLFELKPEYLLIIVSILCLQIVIAAWRWHEILKIMGQSLSFRKSFEMFIAGAVGNLVMLTSLGGMSVKAFMLAVRGVCIRKIAVCLFVERFFVLFALAVAFIFSGLIIKEHFLRATNQLELTSILLISGAAIGVASVISYFCWIYARRFVGPILDDLKIFALHPICSIRLLGLSLVILFVGFTAITIISGSMGVDVPVLMLFSVLPIMAFLASLPIGFGGWGVREGSMVLVFSFLNVGPEDAIAISLLYGLAGMASIFLLALIMLPRITQTKD